MYDRSRLLWRRLLLDVDDTLLDGDGVIAALLKRNDPHA
jgi:hypothetical protein